ncbi:MAG: hypothetical protein RIT43_1204 [Bacteroidota bacterium]
MVSKRIVCGIRFMKGFYFCIMFFILSKALLFLLSPFNWFIVLVALSIFWKSEMWRKRLKWTTVGFFFVFTNTVVLSECFRLWEIGGTKIEKVQKYDVGIVLTGMAEWNNDLKVLSVRRGADRIWQALSLYHEGKIDKILITGDNGYVFDKGLHEAKQMRRVLINWGIPRKDIITECRSRNTHENALETKKLLEKTYPHLNKFLLITSAKHMRRAQGCFRKEGLKCDVFTTDHYTGPKRNYYWNQYIFPNYECFEGWDNLIKETVGYVIYDLVGYI